MRCSFRFFLLPYIRRKYWKSWLWEFSAFFFFNRILVLSTLTDYLWKMSVCLSIYMWHKFCCHSNSRTEFQKASYSVRPIHKLMLIIFGLISPNRWCCYDFFPDFRDKLYLKMHRISSKCRFNYTSDINWWWLHFTVYHCNVLFSQFSW